MQLQRCDRIHVLVTLCLSVVLLPMLARPAHALPGQVLSHQKISDTAGGFAGALDDSDHFGTSVAVLGDLDDDGVTDFAVGAREDDDGGLNRGAVWILLMNANGTVKAHQKISSVEGGFSGSLDNGDLFGSAVGAIGDLDDDDVPDVAVGAQNDDDGGTDRGALWILFLNTNGTVKGHAKISDTQGNFGGGLSNGDNFGASVASLGDLDGDSVIELAVGAQFDDDGGTDRGAVWVLFMQAGGVVDSEAKLSSTTTGLTGNLDDGDAFGNSVARLSDLDNDGVTDLAVGAQSDADGGPARGAVYVVFLTAAAAVDGVQKISDLAGGFNGTLGDSDMFGSAVTEVRDLNNDGVNELAVGASGDDDGGANRGAVWMLFMMPDGTVDFHRKISSTLGTFTGPLLDNDNFGNAVATPRDMNADGVADLVAGAWRTDDGGGNRGAAWVLFLDGVPGAFCGDEVLDPAEECDDGNNDPGDCCEADCDFDPATTPCPNGDVCDGDETCDGAGTCDPGVPLICDDGDLCTQDLCHPVNGCEANDGPAPICFAPGKGKLDVSDKPDPTKDKLNWGWTKGEAFDLIDLGSPQTTTSYALCVYDGESGAPVLERKLEIPPSGLWVAAGTTGFKYKDKPGTNDGVISIQLKSGATGKTKAVVKTRGANLLLPPPEGLTYFQQNPSVIVQLLNDAGSCWNTTFLPPAKKNIDDLFKERLP